MTGRTPRLLVLAGLVVALAGCTPTAASLAGPAGDATLAALPVRASDPGGYRRAAFGPAWADVDHNGCDTRNDILRRDLTGVAYQAGSRCVIVSGTLADPYTGTLVVYQRGRGAGVDVDHVVSLADAWRSGANGWSPDRRLAYANDPAVLLAASAHVNRQKGDSTAAEWAPASRAGTCRYARAVIAVKSRWGLSVTRAERDALAIDLRACR